MFRAPSRVVLDACVLFPFSLRDTLLYMAESGLYQIYWSIEILEEMRRNLVKQKRATAEKSVKLIRVMEQAFPDAMVGDYESLIMAMQNHEEDRHVVAVAVKAKAKIIVTSNLRHFQHLPQGIDAQSPDKFLCSLFALNPDKVIEQLERQARAKKRPPIEFDDLLSGLSKLIPKFVASVRASLP